MRPKNGWVPVARLRGEVVHSVQGYSQPTYNSEAAGKHVVGGLLLVNTRVGECYYPGVLLCHISGPKNFKNRRTAVGTAYATYREIYTGLGSLPADEE